MSSSHTSPKKSSLPFPPTPDTQPFPTPSVLALESLRTTGLLERDAFYREILKSDLELLDLFWSVFANLFAKGVSCTAPSSKQVFKLNRYCLRYLLRKVLPSSSLPFADPNDAERCEGLFVIHHHILDRIYGDFDIVDLEYSVRLFAKTWQLNIVGVLKEQLKMLRQVLVSHGVEISAWSPAYSIELFGTLHGGAYLCYRLWIGIVKDISCGKFQEGDHQFGMGELDKWIHDSTMILSKESVTHPSFPARNIFYLRKEREVTEPEETKIDTQYALRRLAASVMNSRPPARL